MGCNVEAKSGPGDVVCSQIMQPLPSCALPGAKLLQGNWPYSRYLKAAQEQISFVWKCTVCSPLLSWHWLRMNIGPKTEVTLLGRFDSVHFCSETEVESLVLGDGERLQSAGQQLHSRPSKWARVAVRWDTWRKGFLYMAKNILAKSCRCFEFILTNRQKETMR